VSYKKDIVNEFLERFPSAPTSLLAKMLNTNHPLDFPTYDAARSLVRYYRGEHNKKQKEPMRTNEERKAAQGWNKLPESDYFSTLRLRLT